MVAFEEGWIDTSRAENQIGWEMDFLQDGKIINVVEMKECIPGWNRWKWKLRHYARSVFFFGKYMIAL